MTLISMWLWDEIQLCVGAGQGQNECTLEEYLWYFEFHPADNVEKKEGGVWGREGRVDNDVRLAELAASGPRLFPEQFGEQLCTFVKLGR